VTSWMRVVVGTTRREVVVAGVLALALFLVGTAQIPILGLDEGRFSQAAREMLDRGDLVVPTFVGEGRYHKPILVYWLTMASYSVFGVTERAARLPSNLAGALAVMLLAWSARGRFGAGWGLLAGMLLAVTMVFHVEAKACTADMVLFLPTLAVMLAFERMVAGSDDWRLPLVFWVGMALAILAKGPIAPLWVLSTAVALWAYDRRWRPWEVTGLAALLLAGAWSLGPAVLVVPAGIAGWHLVRSSEGRHVLRRLRFGWGVPLMLAVVLPWIVAVELATDGAFLREAIGKHVISRSVSSFESHGFFPGFYLVTAPIVIFPWFAFVFSAIQKGRIAVGARPDQAGPLLDAVLPGRDTAGGGVGPGGGRRRLDRRPCVPAPAAAGRVGGRGRADGSHRLPGCGRPVAPGSGCDLYPGCCHDGCGGGRGRAIAGQGPGDRHRRDRRLSLRAARDLPARAFEGVTPATGGTPRSRAGSAFRACGGLQALR